MQYAACNRFDHARLYTHSNKVSLLLLKDTQLLEYFDSNFYPSMLARPYLITGLVADQTIRGVWWMK